MNPRARQPASEAAEPADVRATRAQPGEAARAHGNPLSIPSASDASDQPGTTVPPPALHSEPASDDSSTSSSKPRVALFVAGLVVVAVVGVRLGGALSGTAREATAQPGASALGPSSAPPSAQGRQVEPNATPLATPTLSAVHAAPRSVASALTPNTTSTSSAAGASASARAAAKPKATGAARTGTDPELDFGGRK